MDNTTYSYVSPAEESTPYNPNPSNPYDEFFKTYGSQITDAFKNANQPDQGMQGMPQGHSLTHAYQAPQAPQIPMQTGMFDTYQAMSPLSRLKMMYGGM